MNTSIRNFDVYLNLHIGMISAYRVSQTHYDLNTDFESLLNMIRIDPINLCLFLPTCSIVKYDMMPVNTRYVMQLLPRWPGVVTISSYS